MAMVPLDNCLGALGQLPWCPWTIALVTLDKCIGNLGQMNR